MNGLFRWGSDTIVKDMNDWGWKYCTPLVLGEAESGGDCFNDYLKCLGEFEDDRVVEKDFVMTEFSGAMSEKRTFYVVSHSDREEHQPYSKIDVGGVLTKTTHQISGEDTVIVVLGKALVKDEEMGNELKARVLRGVELNRKLAGSTIVFSGGKGEAEKMLAFGKLRFGSDSMDKFVMEDRSTNTRENARNCCAIIRTLKSGCQKVVVVTSNYHAKRAERIFRGAFKKEGLGEVEISSYSNFYAVPEEATNNEARHASNL